MDTCGSRLLLVDEDGRAVSVEMASELHDVTPEDGEWQELRKDDTTFCRVSMPGGHVVLAQVLSGEGAAFAEFVLDAAARQRQTSP